jgi:uncharacterized protein (DUF427 family)
MKVIFNGAVLAESDHTVMLEGYHYFPPESIQHEYFQDSSLHTICPRKGQASYYHVKVDDKTISDVAWYYPQPNDGFGHIKNHVAFDSGKIVLQ